MMDPATAIAGAAAAWALGAYCDAKFHFRKDLEEIMHQREARLDYEKQVKLDRINLWYIVAERCKQYQSSNAIWFQGHWITYEEFYEQTVRYAQWLLDEGVRPGELVGMYLMNSPEFMMIWFATLCIGAAPAFVNYNLEGGALVHCLSVCETKIIIADSEDGCRRRVEGSRAAIEGEGVRIITLDDEAKHMVASKHPICPDDKYRSGTQGSFPFCLLFTSGTTGLPKGCAYTQGRLRLSGCHLKNDFDGKPGRDTWYNSMPLYHGTGAITSAAALFGGLGLAIAPKFSVSRFWDDIDQSGATMAVYVGETARYLLNAPPHPLETSHKLRVCYGNGLGQDVWGRFQQRFNIPEIAEFYGSTEGMIRLANWDRGPYLAGCVGHYGLLLRFLLRNKYVPVAIDHATGDIWRDPQTGFARRNTYAEGGEILVKVLSRAAFQGYWKNQNATDKKFATDVFKKGDIWYRCGDALRMDEEGKWYFMDRLGDTFRWKSENVSTTEVSNCLGRFPGVAEANVYGVLVPNHEGRAGCAALTLAEGYSPLTFDYDGMLKHARRHLPRYAVPIFLRAVKTSSHIHNNKQNKVPLRKEGVNPALIGTEEPGSKDDTLLWLYPGTDSYVPFDESHWGQLEVGKAKL